MTAHVTVLLHAMFREIVGEREIAEDLSSDGTLLEVLDKLAQKYGKDFKHIIDSKTRQISVDTLVMLNGQSVRKTDLKLKDGDVVMISVPIGGG